MRHPLVLAATLGLFWLGPAHSQNTGTDISGSVANRDNTRILGTVFDSAGNPLPKVEIFITNDNAPANRVRAKSRKDGNFLARQLLQIMTREEPQGITARAVFQMKGYRTVETTMGVARDGIARIYPILWKEGETPKLDKVYMALWGRVRDGRGKSVKRATIHFSSPDDPDFAVTAEAVKGEYEAFLWQAPRRVLMTVESEGHPAFEKEFTLDPPEAADVMTSATFHVNL